jgi:hypothetical protein
VETGKVDFSILMTANIEAAEILDRLMRTVKEVDPAMLSAALLIAVAN